MSKSFLILGAGMAGLPLAHYVLKHYANQHDLKVTLVSKSSDFYWNIASPRCAIPGQLTDDKTFYSIADAFSKYSSTRFEFVLGTVETWDPDRNTINLVDSYGSKKAIIYHTILVATGSAYANNMPWKLVGSSDDTKTALSRLRQEIQSAKSIVIGGGGPTGVEFAGELAYEYAREGAQKSITLVMSDSLPLPAIVMTATRQAAKKELEKLDVNIIANAKITETPSDQVPGKRMLGITKTDGSKQSLEADLFVPTWGVKFNTGFAPPSMLENDGRLKVTKQLRAPGYENVFAVGDAANLDSYAAAVREAQVRHLAMAFGKYLAEERVPEYKQDDRTTMTVTVGQSRGVGQIGSWNAWSFFIWFFKGRHMCTNIVPDYVAGNTLILGSF
ncbi:FAD/NAD(P)-binding domain-containing protein [Periconia macrospinosa]|uniref:FAD/NAD(P)-binding domain-containing protein n=1 Tax=Periconia macrospinosa TaxID=97972 RepID=A0A2V1DRG7_9PLEO|nr:FAD/NAD(P)-binding domain-containing protein [Periconia macrospinosa]